MALVTSKEMLEHARQNGYAVGAFNVENMEMIKAVLKAAEELKAPVILQTTPSTVQYGSLETFVAMVQAEAAKVCIPAVLHLDHGNSTQLARQALQAGYTSVMIDGSGEDYDCNLDMSRQISECAHASGIPVEAELGRVGGKEDGLCASQNLYTDPETAKEFVEKTGIDSLAVSIGTAHGFYEGEPKLDKERLQEIRKMVKVPLVLHGASGLKQEDIQDCIQRGICKVNFATELRVAYTEAVRKLLQEDASVIDPKKLGKAGMKAVEEVVKQRILVCGCTGKAV